MAASAKKHVAALDGLRGIAVLMVLLFHLQVPGFDAGFLGVDVFFVLSGFLITTLLLGEAQRTGRVSLAEFWTRRFRRLMPAVVVLLVTVAAVGWVASTSSERQRLRGDLLSTTFYVANWHFIGSSDYFADDGEESPLEHAWSLAIEEQFYVVWPLAVSLLLLGGRRRPKAEAESAAEAPAEADARFGRGNGRVAGVAALLVLISVGLLVAHRSGAGVERAYMGTDSRMFEPLAGALAATALATQRGRRLVDRFGRAGVMVGAAALIGAMVLIAAVPTAYYLGGAAMTTLATVLVVAGIWRERGAVVGSVLAWPPLVWVGAISYGFYLWHWPLTVWSGVRDAAGTQRLVLAGGVILSSLAASALSYYVVEQPIRSGALGRQLSPRRMAYAVPLLLLAIGGSALAATRPTSVTEDTPSMVVLGDSVPMRLVPTLERHAERRGWSVVSGAAGGCPVTGEEVITSTGRPLASGPVCEQQVPQLRAEALASDPDVVIWWDRFSVADWKADNGDHIRAGTDEFWRLRQDRLAEHVTELTRAGAHVVFVAAEPPGKGVATRCSADRCHEWVRRQIDEYDDLTSRWNDMLRDFAQHHPDSTTFLSITDGVCHDEVVPCNDLVDGVPVRGDGTHYTGKGKPLAADLLLDGLAPLLTR